MSESLPVPVQKWLEWEARANEPIYRNSLGTVEIDIVEAPRALFEIAINPDVPRQIRKFVQSETLVRWPKHPLNNADHVPFFQAVPAFKRMGYFTASRSLVLLNEDNTLLGIKVPTNFPQPAIKQESKTDLRDELKQSLFVTDYLKKSNRQLARDSNLIFLFDVASIALKGSGNGYLVRDLSPLNDGYYYLPAFSIPHVVTGMSVQELFEFFSTKVGAAKARLLIKYGIELVTPNAQNWLIQLDGNLKPTGNIVIRDLSDIRLIKPIVEGLGRTTLLAQAEELGIPVANSGFVPSVVSPFAANTFGSFDSSLPVVSDFNKRQWKYNIICLHDVEYVNEIIRLLDLDSNVLGSEIETSRGSYSIKDILKGTPTTAIEKMGVFLQSCKARTAIETYHARQGGR